MIRTLLLGLGLWLALASAAGARTLTVVGFNVESDDSVDTAIARQLELSEAVDLWGLVNVWDEEWPDVLQRGAAVGEGSGFGRLLGTTGGVNRLLVLYREDRLRVLNHEEIDAARVGRDAAPLAVRFELDSGQEFIFLVVGLSDQKKRRLRQAEALRAWSADVKLPVIAVGTFNFDEKAGRSPGSRGFETLAGGGGWRWVEPVEPVATQCGMGKPVRDFVFLAGPDIGWQAESAVMFPQPNYCPGTERTSSYRPVLAAFAPSGSTLIAGGMPDRQVVPMLPGGAQLARDQVQARNIRSPDGLREAEEADPGEVAGPVASPDSASRTELLQRIEVLEREAAERDAAEAAAAPAAPSPTPAGSADIEASPPAGAPPPASAPPVEPAPAPGVASDAEAEEAARRRAILERIEALEREILELKDLVEEPDGS